MANRNMKNFVSELRDVFCDREIYKLDWYDTLIENKSYVFSGLLLYVLAVVVRSWTNYSHPGLYVEDSMHYFNYYYGNFRHFSDIFQHPNGYYNIYNNLMAWLIAWADILWQPFLYQLTSTIIAILAICAFSLSGLLKNRFTLFICPLLLGLSGMNHIYYYITLTFQMYVVIVLLLGILFWQKSSVPLFNLIYIVLASFLIWSGPYSVMTVPFCLTFVVLFRGKTTINICLLVVTLAYTLSVTQSTFMLENLFSKNIMQMWGKALVTEVFFMGFKDSVNLERLLLIFATLTFLMVFLRKEKYYLKVSLLFAVIIISSFAPLFLSQKYLLYQTIFPCHLFIAQFFWLAFVLYSLDKILLRLKRYQNGVGILIVALCATFIVFDNYNNVDKYSVPILSSTPAFLQKVKEAEGMGLEKKGQNMVITTNGTGPFRAKALVGDRSKGAVLINNVHVE